MAHIKRIVQAVGRHKPKKNRGLHNADTSIPGWWVNKFDKIHGRLPRPSWHDKNDQ